MPSIESIPESSIDPELPEFKTDAVYEELLTDPTFVAMATEGWEDNQVWQSLLPAEDREGQRGFYRSVSLGSVPVQRTVQRERIAS